MIQKLVWGLLALALACAPAWAGSAADEKAVRDAILDYVEGVYGLDTKRIERSVHPELAKRGYYRDDGAWVEAPMTFSQLVELAATYNKDGHIPANAPKKIELFEVGLPQRSWADQKLARLLEALEEGHVLEREGHFVSVQEMEQDHLVVVVTQVLESELDALHRVEHVGDDDD